MTRTAVSSASVSSAYSRTISRNASASHRPRPRIACWPHGPESPAASARIQPVFRGSLPRSPSRNFSADAATRSWLNNGRIRAFTSRNDDAQSSSVVSTDAPAIHDLPNHGGPSIQKFEQNATVMLGGLARARDVKVLVSLSLFGGLLVRQDRQPLSLAD